MNTRTPPSPPETLPYASPTPRAARAGAGFASFGWGVCLWSGLLVAAWIALMVIVVPLFQKTLADFNVELPPATRVLLSTRAFVVRGGWALLLLIPIGLGFVAGTMGPGGRRGVRMLVTVLFGLVIALTVLGIFQPLISLIDAMSSAK
jgi:hypothetical protein